MKDIALNFQRDAASSQGVAQIAGSQNTGVRTNRLANDFSKKSVVTLILTADNAGGTAAISTFNLFPGIGKGAVAALPAGVTVGGDYATWADWIAYCQGVGMYVNKIWMQSADTTNFNGQLTYGLIMPNGTTPNETFYQLQDFKVSTGNGFADNITIPVDMVTVPNFYAKLTINKNTVIRIQLTIPEVNVSADTTPVSF